jgi:hypothetical protein
MLKLRDSFTTETRLRVTLDEAIEIHAKALKFRYGRTAPHRARERADNCSAAGDREGHVVWEKVAVIAENLLEDCRAVAFAPRNMKPYSVTCASGPNLPPVR